MKSLLEASPVDAAPTATLTGVPPVVLKLFSTEQMLVAALLGGPVAAFLMLALNRSELGRSRTPYPTLVVGCVIAIVLGAVAQALPRGVPADLSFILALLTSQARLSAVIPFSFSLLFWVGLRTGLSRAKRDPLKEDVSVANWPSRSATLVVLFTNIAMFFAALWLSALKYFAMRWGWGR